MDYDDGHYWHSINDGERWNLDNTIVFDNDGGAAKFAPANAGENSLFYTSRISLQGTDNPLLTFHYWHVKNSDMLLEVMVSKTDRSSPSGLLISQRIPIRPDGKRELFCLTNSRMRTTSL